MHSIKLESLPQFVCTKLKFWKDSAFLLWKGVIMGI